MPICPNCLSRSIVKFGKYRGTQRWRCMSCRRTTLFVRRRMPRGSRNITQEIVKILNDPQNLTPSRVKMDHGCEVVYFSLNYNKIALAVQELLSSVE